MHLKTIWTPGGLPWRRAATIHHQSNIMTEYSRAVLTFARMLDAVWTRASWNTRIPQILFLVLRSVWIQVFVNSNHSQITFSKCSKNDITYCQRIGFQCIFKIIPIYFMKLSCLWGCTMYCIFAKNVWIMLKFKFSFLL